MILKNEFIEPNLCIANEEMVTQFCAIVKPLLQKIKDNIVEISKLSKLRDEMLPMLLNGQVNCDLSHRKKGCQNQATLNNQPG